MSIVTLAAQNDDALANHFQINIPNFPGVLNLEGTNIRVLTVEIPERTVSTYEIHYRSQKLTKYGSKDTTPNQFTFTYRVDKNWQVYKGLESWHRLLNDPITGAQVPDFENGISGIRVPISVICIDSSGQITSTGWSFQGCFPSNVPSVSFSMEDGNPIIVTQNMEFITMDPLLA